MNASRLIMLFVLTITLLPGCSALVPGLSSVERPGLRATAMRSPELVPSRIRVTSVNAHHAVVTAQRDAATGSGVWLSSGTHAEPAAGYEAKVAADGSFELGLHAHPGDALTLWAFSDTAGERRYSLPLSLVVPSR